MLTKCPFDDRARKTCKHALPAYGCDLSDDDCRAKVKEPKIRPGVIVLYLDQATQEHGS